MADLEGTDSLHANALSRTLGECDIPSSKLLALSTKPALEFEGIRLREQIRVVVNCARGHGKNCLHLQEKVSPY